MIPNSANKMVNTTIDITQYINTEYFSVNNGVAYLIKVGKLRMIKVDVTLKKQINTDVYLFNFPANFLEGMINTYFFGNLINRNGKPYEVAFYNQLASNNFSILVQVATGNTIENNSRLIGEWAGFCSADINDTSEEENKFITHNQFNILISEALKGYTKNTTLEESQAKQDELIQKLKKALINETTEQDTSLHIEDASDLPAVLSVQGNHYQEQQEGTSNLAVLNEGSITQDGITVNVENGVATMSGSNTSDTTNYVVIGTAYLYAGQTYYMSAERQQTSGNSGLSIKLGSLVKWFTVGQEVVFECTETGEYEVRVSFGVSTVANLGTLKYLISKTSGAEWVQGKKAIPSVEYPSPIRTVGDNINYFSEDYYSCFSVNQQAIKEIIDDEIKVTTTANAYSGIYLNTVVEAITELTNKLKNKDVTYSFEIKADTDITINYGKNGNSKNVNVTNEYQRCYITYLASNDIEIYFYNSSATVTTFYIRKIKLEEGTEATSCSFHNMGAIKIIQCNSNFLKKQNAVENVTARGLTGNVASDGTITLNGTATNDTYIQLTDELKIADYYASQNYVKHLLPAGNYKFVSEVSGQVSTNNIHAYLYHGDTESFLNNINIQRISESAKKETTFILESQWRYYAYLLIRAGTTLTDFKMKFMLKRSDDNSEYIQNEEQEYILPIQEEMLEEDYFDLENNKEVHNWNKVTLTGTENISVNSDTNDYIEFKISNVLPNTAKTGYNVTYSTHFSSTTNNRCLSYNKDLLIRIPKPNELTTAELFKTWLQENNVDVYYPLAEAIELELIENQKETLSQTNNLYLYKGTNNICTEQDLALLKLDYTVDTKTYIDNKIASNNAGGN